MNLLIFGPQGAGKGTQAARISEEYGIPHVSTGDMLRSAITAGTELGRRVQSIVERGDLVPDDLMVELIRERLAVPDAAAGVVLEVPDEVATARMLERARSEGRSDDTPETIARRLSTYHEQTAPLVEWYRARDKVAPVDGTPPIEAVWSQIHAALGRFEVPAGS